MDRASKSGAVDMDQRLADTTTPVSGGDFFWSAFCSLRCWLGNPMLVEVWQLRDTTTTGETLV